MKKNLTEDRLRGMFTLLFEGKEAKAKQAISRPMMECVTPGGLGR